MHRCSTCRRDVPEGAFFCPFCRAPMVPRQIEGAPPDPYVGRTLKDVYLIQEKIGSGGMGQVYRAVQINLNRLVAVKVLHASLHADPTVVEQFHREARAVSRLHHPNVINVIDFGQTEDDTLFMAMELVAGQSASMLLRNEFPLGERRVVYILAQVLGALSAAHAAGIIHRDIKPQNIMVESRENEPDFVKVLDFGIAKIQDTNEDSSALTQTAFINGTPFYMSPEQIMQRPLDPRSDLYSTGIVLYEMLTSSRPFAGETPLATLRGHIETPPPPMVNRLPPGHRVSPALEAIVHRALAKSPADRFASATEMRQALLACELGPDLAIRGTPSAGGAGAMLDAALDAARRSKPPTSSLGRLPTGARSKPSEDIPSPAPFPDDRTEIQPSEQGLVGAIPLQRRWAMLRAGGAIAGTLAAAALALRIAGGSHGAPMPKPSIPMPVNAEAKGSIESSPELPPARPRSAVEPEERLVPTPVNAEAKGSIESSPELPPTRPRSAVEPEEPLVPTPVVEKSKPGVKRPGAPSVPARSDLAPPARQKRIHEVMEVLNSLPTPPASSGEGILAISAEPPGEVYVNNLKIGESPREMRVYAGAYQIRIENRAYGKATRRLTVRAGSRESWTAKLSR